MGIRVYKPVTAGRRNASVSDFAELTKGAKREPSLLVRAKVIPNTHSQYIRHVVNIKAKVKGSSEAPITIFDVSSIGMCAASSSFNSFGKVTMEVAISEERVSVVIGEICWKDVDRNIVGIRLVEADSNWLDFIEYLGNDLVVLAEESQKKAS